MPQDMEKKPFERAECGERRERGPRRERREPSEFQEKMVSINRVSKTVKGGRNMRFAVLMVVGDGKGRVGCGIGKATEIPEAARKATEDAKKHLVHVSMKGTSIPHETVGRFGTGEECSCPLRKAPALSPAVRPVRCSSCAALRTSAPRAMVPTTRLTW